MPGAFEADIPLKVLSLGAKIIRAYDNRVHFMKRLGKASGVIQKFHQWDVWPVATPTLVNVNEGVDKNDGYTSEQPKTVSAYASEVRSEGYMVTERAQRAEQKEVASELAKQIMRDEEKIVMGIECQLLSNAEMDDGSVSGRTSSRGAMNWLRPVTGTSLYGTGTYSQHAVAPVNAAIATSASTFYDGNIGSYSNPTLTEAYAIALVNSCAQNTLGPVNLNGICGVQLKQVFSSFTDVKVVTTGTVAQKQFYMDQTDKMLLNSVDIFEFDGGRVTNEISYYVASTAQASSASAAGVIPWNVIGGYNPYSGVFIDPKYWKISWAQPIAHVDQDPNNTKGAGKRGFHKADYMLIPESLLGQFAVFANA
jgi:hypothetical protein